MIAPPLAAGIAVFALLGAVPAGVAVPGAAVVAGQIELTGFGAPLAPAPADLPTPGQLTGVLSNLADPAVPFADKAGLVEGGIGPAEASVADHKLHKAERKGQLPLSFSVANIEPTGPGAATADVTVSGPKLAPRTINVAFVNQDGWKVSLASATQLLRAASEK